METILATAITLFLIMDPLGNVPIFLVVLERVAGASSCASCCWRSR